MSVSFTTKELDAIKPVYTSVVKYLTKNVASYGTSSISLSSWDEVQQTLTEETFILRMFEISDVDLIALANVLNGHPCFLQCHIKDATKAERCLDMCFLWVDPNESKSVKPKSKQQQHTKHNDDVPSFTSFFSHIALGLANAALFYYKGPLFGM
jgi:hypothetical protein